MLRCTKIDGEASMHQAKGGANKGCGQYTGGKISPHIDRRPAHHRTNRHDALNAKIENPRALTHQFAQRGQQ